MKTIERAARAPPSQLAATAGRQPCEAGWNSDDNCYGVRPDNAVLKLGEPGERCAIDCDSCKGCGLGVAGCPCEEIEIVPEEI